MIDRIKNKLKWAFTTKMGLGVTTIILVVIFGIINKITDSVWSYNAAGVGVLLLVAASLVWIAFGVIINPIRGYVNKRKNKE